MDPCALCGQPRFVRNELTEHCPGPSAEQMREHLAHTLAKLDTKGLYLGPVEGRQLLGMEPL